MEVESGLVRSNENIKYRVKIIQTRVVLQKIQMICDDSIYILCKWCIELQSRPISGNLVQTKFLSVICRCSFYHYAFEFCEFFYSMCKSLLLFKRSFRVDYIFYSTCQSRSDWRIDLRDKSWYSLLVMSVTIILTSY